MTNIALIEEYKSLVDGIKRADDLISKIMVVLITASGGILGYSALSYNGYICLILYFIVIPTYYYTLDQRELIFRIASYIRCVIEKDEPFLRWENSIAFLREKIGKKYNRRIGAITFEWYISVSILIGAFLFSTYLLLIDQTILPYIKYIKYSVIIISLLVTILFAIISRIDMNKLIDDQGGICTIYDDIWSEIRKE